MMVRSQKLIMCVPFQVSIDVIGISSLFDKIFAAVHQNSIIWLII